MSEQEQAGPVPGGEPPDEGWNDIAQEFGLNFEELEGVEFQGGADAERQQQEQAEYQQATDAEKLLAAEMMINGGLRFAIWTIAGLKIPEKHYSESSKSWAAVIVKHFRGGIFEFMARWREELAAIMSMLLLIAAIREAARAKKAKDVTPDDVAVGGESAEPA